MKKIHLFLLFVSVSVFSQIGVGTTNPKATLDVSAINPTGIFTNVDGIIIPRVDRQRAQNMTSIEVSTLIYVIDETTGSASGIASEINQKGFYYYNGSKWARFNLSTSTALDIGYIVGWSASTNPPDYLIPVSGGTFNWADYPDLQVLNTTHPLQFIQSSNATTFTLKDINGSGKFLRGSSTAGTVQSQSTALPTVSFTTNSTGDHSHTTDPATVTTSSDGNHQHDLNMVSKDDGNFSNVAGQFPTGDANKYNGTNHNIQVETAGAHNHTVDIPSTASSTTGNHLHTITGGGDAETRPTNISVIWCLKAKPTNSTGSITINNGNITSLTTNGTSGVSSLTGSTLNIPQYASSTIGDIKSGVQATDHNGWVKLDGRSISSLTTTQQTNATAIGLAGNLPNANNSYLSQNGSTLGSISNSNTKTISQNQLPNVTLSGTTNGDGGHRHNIRSEYGTGTVNNSPPGQYNQLTTNTSYPLRNDYTQNDGNHTHTFTTSSINGNVAQQSLDVRPLTLSVNMFIYLGN